MSEDAPGKGERLERREDSVLLSGEGEYVDDLDPERLAFAAILRSQYAHADVRSIDTAPAEARDGVLGVFTSEDVDPQRTDATIPTLAEPPSDPPLMDVTDGPFVPRRPMLARDRVRYTGEAIAVVVAEDRYTAHDATSSIDVDYGRRDAVVDSAHATQEDAPQLHDEIRGNLGFTWEIGDRRSVEAALDDATHTVSLDLDNQRLAPNSMEPRGALADYDHSDDSMTVWLSTQSPHNHRALFSHVLDLPEDRIRVVAPKVGGGFGLKSKYFPGEPIAAWASRQVGRPVKWIATRSEAFRTDAHGRCHDTSAVLGVDDDGSIVALQCETSVNLGAYLSMVEGNVATGNYATLLSGQYDIPAIHAEVRGVYTNTAPVDAYRGAGRPEAGYVVERLVNRAATELGRDPAEFRRSNFIDADAFPFETAVGTVYDSGDYESAMERALDLIDYDHQRARQSRLRDEGRYLGIGFGCLVESTAGARGENGTVTLGADGTVTAYVGTLDHGQGHETSFAQVLADELGVPYDDIEIVEGDTALIPEGGGTFGSRSAIMGGNVLVQCAREVIEEARSAAADRLETAAADVEFDAGEFHVRGAPGRSISIQDVAGEMARESTQEGDVATEATGSLDGLSTNPFGAHACVVEVDPETGDLSIERYVAVDDCGPQLNPMIVEGQVHGAVTQGLGQALYEAARYDDNGTLVTGSLQDYAIPKAEHVPDITTSHTVTPSPLNELGVKGIGEAGTIAAPPALVNAALDALAPLDVTELSMPLSSETIWTAIQEA